MKTHFYFTSNIDGSVLTNMSKECLPCVHSCKSKNEKLICENNSQERRRGAEGNEKGFYFICTDKAIKSTRIFKEKKLVIKLIIDSYEEARYQQEVRKTININRFIHNLLSINASNLQSIYSFIPQENFAKRNRVDIVESIKEIIKSRPNEASKLFIDVAKNEQLEKTEFSIYEKLFGNASIEKLPYKIHSVVLLILNTFWENFSDSSVHFNIGESYSKVLFDYECLAGTLVHLFDNAAKYIMPRSALNIIFEESDEEVLVKLEMLSLKIEEHEKELIFEEEISGSLPNKLDKNGKGLGLSIVKKLLHLTEGNI